MNDLPSLILASASPRRQDLLQQLGTNFDVYPSEAEEVHSEYLTVSELCQINAYRKARVVSKKYPDAVVLAADTLVAMGTKLYGKPSNLQEAEQMLAQLQGRTHEVVTGVCLIQLRNHQQKTFSEMSLVTFKSLTRQQIRDYLKKVNPLDKAGGYALQEHGHEIIDHVDGSESNVVGLPLERLKEELDAFDEDAVHA